MRRERLRGKKKKENSQKMRPDKVERHGSGGQLPAAEEREKLENTGGEKYQPNPSENPAEKKKREASTKIPPRASRGSGTSRTKEKRGAYATQI